MPRWPVTWLLACLVLTGCTFEATEVLVQFNTDAPLDRRMVVTATVYGADSTRRPIVRSWERTDAGRASTPGVDAGVVRFPASFAVVPGNGPRDATVTLALDATLAGRTATDPPLQFRRVVRFRFTPGRTTVLPVFLSMSCGSPAPNCTTVPLSRCTVSIRCEEMGRTCGDRGMCVDPLADPHPITPGDREAGVLGGDATLDTRGSDARSDVATDTRGMDVRPGDAGPCSGGCPAPAHGTAMCVSNVCMITCAPGFGNCDANDANGCEAALDSTSHCGTCGQTCPAGQLCMTGACVPSCTGGTVLCGGSCANLQTSSTNCGACGNACASGMECSAGRCVLICAGGTTLCGGACADLQTSTSNCGACGTTCPARANGSPVCSGGSCGVACNAGWANCDGSVTNGCETNVDSSTSDCGGCGRGCAPANASAQCSSGLCGIAACNSGWYDLNATASDGCECVRDSNGPDCGSATPVGPIGVGGSTTLGGNLVPAGSNDWFVVSFAPGGHPHITLGANPGGQTLGVMNDCAGNVTCTDGSGGSVNDWEFSDTAGPHTTRDIPFPTQVIVHVQGGSAVCAQYSVSVTN